MKNQASTAENRLLDSYRQNVEQNQFNIFISVILSKSDRRRREDATKNPENDYSNHAASRRSYQTPDLRICNHEFLCDLCGKCCLVVAPPLCAFVSPWLAVHLSLSHAFTYTIATTKNRIV